MQELGSGKGSANGTGFPPLKHNARNTSVATQGNNFYSAGSAWKVAVIVPIVRQIATCPSPEKSHIGRRFTRALVFRSQQLPQLWKKNSERAAGICASHSGRALLADKKSPGGSCSRATTWSNRRSQILCPCRTATSQDLPFTDFGPL